MRAVLRPGAGPSSCFDSCLLAGRASRSRTPRKSSPAALGLISTGARLYLSDLSSNPRYPTHYTSGQPPRQTGVAAGVNSSSGGLVYTGGVRETQPGNSGC